ncbi:MAG: NAD-dependent epimerase/dehydratase family protein, partial [Muribaculaceae bacterium]|nr:NAD-dependent epimerase/dehydratase family protein [Muribaculaceae bacterium]
NLYGPNDNFHLENSHVLPAMIRKMHLARLLSENRYDLIRQDLTARLLKDFDHIAATDEEIADRLARFGIYADRLELWGSGKPLREFLWSEDMADASVHVLLNVNFDDLKKRVGDGDIRNTHINVGTGKELTIAELAEKIRKAVGFNGEIRWDATKPDGTMRKLCDVTRLHDLGWHHKVDLDEGIPRLYNWYLETTSTVL